MNGPNGPSSRVGRRDSFSSAKRNPRKAPKPRRVRRALAQKLIPVVVVVVVVVALAGSFAAIAGLGAKPGIAIPNVVGLARAGVEERLASLKFTVTVAETTADDPAGTVIAQQPDAGVVVRDGANVQITVSSGPAAITVPKLLGLDDTTAAAQLQAAGLIGKSVLEFDDGQPKGKVIASTLDGQNVAPDSEVHYTVSNGHRPVKVPKIEGLVVADAVKRLKALGFVVTIDPVQVFSDIIKTGAVVASLPIAGETHSYRSPITLTVSKGPDVVVMPNVVGIPFPNACTLLNNNGLTCATATGPLVTNIVISADHLAGDKVKRATAIHLVVG